MRVPAGLAAVLAVLGGAAPAHGADASARQIAEALKRDPVFVDESAAGLLSTSEASRLRSRIARQDRGRIQIVVVSEGRSARSGGLATVANAVDQAWGPERRGALVLTDSKGFQMVTSFANPQTTTAALRSAVTGYRAGGSAARWPRPWTPSPRWSPGERPTSPAGCSCAGTEVGPARRCADDRAARRAHRPRGARRRHHRDGPGYRDAGRIGAGPGDYNRAVELYQRASRALDERHPSDAELPDIQRSLHEGRARIESARAALGA